LRVTVTPEQIRSAFEAVKDDPAFEESRGIWERGRPPVEMLQAMCLRPEILRAFGGFGDGLYPGGLLERRVQELVILTASHANDCQFCINAHVDIVDIEDILDEPLALITEPATLPARERLAVEYSRAATLDSNHIPEPLLAELKEAFSDPELVELTFLIGYINMLNLFNNSLGIRYDGDYRVLAEDPQGQAGGPSSAPAVSRP
jgi:alkylhydroperoxidase family enzyme